MAMSVRVAGKINEGQADQLEARVFRAGSRDHRRSIQVSTGISSSGGSSEKAQGRSPPAAGRAYTDDSVCPSLSFLVFRYLRVESLAGISSGTAAEMASP